MIKLLKVFVLRDCVAKTKSLIETKLLRFIFLKSRKAVTSSNKQKRNLITHLLNIFNRRKSVTFYNPPLKKCGYYVIPSVQKVALSVRRSVATHEWTLVGYFKFPNNS